MRITKSDYLAFVQCPKLLWLARHEDVRPTPPDPNSQRRMRMGQEVDQRARLDYPEGIHIPYRPKPLDMVPLTQQALANGAATLFQATFSIDNLLIKADILTRTAHGWHLIEVKSSTSVKPEHLPDVAFQQYVLELAGLNISQLSIMHLNSECRAPDLSNLFLPRDVTTKSFELQPQVAADIKIMRQTLTRSAVPDVHIGRQCQKPYACPFYEHCWRDIAGLTIFDIPRLNVAKEARLQDDDIIYLTDIPADNELTVKQRQFVERFVQQQVMIDNPAIRGALDELVYPLYFFDFETIDYAVPPFDNCKPYQQIPFQYSCHILAADGTLTHVEYLHTESGDPREDLVTALVDHIGATGHVIVYYAPFERGRLRELAVLLPQYAELLNGIEGRLWDQLDIFRKSYHHFGFGKSNSLKSVLPVVVPALSYLTLDVQNGTQAQVTWEEMIVCRDVPYKTKLANQLRDYCHLDTLAMVEIHNTLSLL